MLNQLIISIYLCERETKNPDTGNADVMSCSWIRVCGAVMLMELWWRSVGQSTDPSACAQCWREAEMGEGAAVGASPHRRVCPGNVKASPGPAHPCRLAPRQGQR